MTVIRSLAQLTLSFSLLAVSFSVEAQQPPKLPRIGYLTGATPEAQSTRTNAFRQGLRDVGYVEGKNIIIEWRYANGKPELYAGLAAELAHLKVDVIVTGGSNITRAAQEVTTTIPIIMAQDNDPVANGFVISLSHPGGNITGLSNFSPELSGKRLELLKEIESKLSRVAVLESSTTESTALLLKELQPTAGALGIKLQLIDVSGRQDIETAFSAANKGHAEAILNMVPGPIALAHRFQIAALAVKSRLPVIYERAIYVEAGGLIYYGVNVLELDRRAAIYVEKILKGAKPEDLPVEQPKKFELVINSNAAKQIGLIVSPNVLARADRIIK